MAEGKVFGFATMSCGLCEEGDSEKYCDVCQVSLCRRCAKSHGKLPSTMKHDLVKLQTSAWKTSTDSGQIMCQKHPSVKRSMPVTSVCNCCWGLLCMYCAKDICKIQTQHNRRQHYPVKLPDNQIGLQTICLNKIGILTNLHGNLNQLKESSGAYSKLVKKSQERINLTKSKLVKILHEDATHFFGRAEKELAAKEKIALEISNCVEPYLNETFKLIVNLQKKDCGSNVTVTLNTLQKTEKEMEKFQELVDHSEPFEYLKTVDDVLPFMQTIEHELASVQSAFGPRVTISSRSGPSNRPSSTQNFRSEVILDQAEIGQNHIGSGGTFRISGYVDPNDDTILIYKVGGCDVYFFNIHEYTIKDFICPKTIRQLETVAPQNHVIIEESPTRVIHLLDGQFQVVSSMDNSNSGNKPYAMCAKETDVFLLLEVTPDGRSSIWDVHVRDKKMERTALLDFNIFDNEGLLCFSGQQITMVYNDTSLCTVNIQDQTRTSTTNVIKNNAKIKCILALQNDMRMLGDNSGNLHLLQNVGQQKIVKASFNSQIGITAIAMKEGKLVIVQGEYVSVISPQLIPNRMSAFPV